MLPTQELENLIFEIKGLNVMLDSDLATLYGTESKRLKEQVRRNIGRFPEDFMFELTQNEKEQLVASTQRLANLKFSPVLPMVFTEQGVAMLSSVLNSETAIAVNIQIIRVFTRMRTLFADHKDVLLQLEKLSGTVSHHLRDIRAIFRHLKQMEQDEEERRLLTQIAKTKPRPSPDQRWGTKPGTGKAINEIRCFTNL